MSSKIIVILGAIVALVLWFTAYTVDQRERVILFNLGKIKQVDVPPGLHFKIPVANNILRFDGRILTLDAQPERFLTSEKKNVIVDFFAKWRISDVASFYKATQGREAVAQNRLLQILKDGLRNEFAKRTIVDAISGERSQIMSSIYETSNVLSDELGIEVVDVRISRIDFDEKNSESVYKRMRSERSRIAKELRATGREESEILRADADRQRTVLVAEAYRDAQKSRGSGEAKAAETYAKAYNKDADFFSFYRSLESYQKAFSGGSDVMMLEPDSEFLRFFNPSQSDQN